MPITRPKEGETKYAATRAAEDGRTQPKAIPERQQAIRIHSYFGENSRNSNAAIIAMVAASMMIRRSTNSARNPLASLTIAAEIEKAAIKNAADAAGKPNPIP